MRRQLAWRLVIGYSLVTAGAVLLHAAAAPFLAGAAEIGVTLLILAVAVAITHRVTRAWTRPLEVLRRAAEQYAAGHLSRRLPVPPSDELGGLVEAMNEMAAQLHERLRALRQQRNELEAVLASMGEAVLAVDTHERVLRVNGALLALFGIDPPEVVGRSLYEVVRHARLQALIQAALAGGDGAVDDLIVRRAGTELFVQARVTPLLDGAGQQLGVLVMLADVTRLRGLERVRQEFVANVTHELRTPVTAIQGFVETLLDGAVADPADARRFLEIVARHAARLEKLIEDLLQLAQLDPVSDGRGAVELADCDLVAVLRGARSGVELLAAERTVRIEVAGDPVRVRGNGRLLEAAVSNLLENAIKYSERGGRVAARVTVGDGTARLEVQDWGVGIAAEHHARLFERFYRVDQARSRELGGTGLGLAIVKHIAQAHGGRVGVDSALGRGSTFWIELPVSS